MFIFPLPRLGVLLSGLILSLCPLKDAAAKGPSDRATADALENRRPFAQKGIEYTKNRFRRSPTGKRECNKAQHSKTTNRAAKKASLLNGSPN